jgi:hypothetical protein
MAAKPSKKTEIFRKKQCDFLYDGLQKAAKNLSKKRSSILTSYRFRSKRKSFRRAKFAVPFVVRSFDVNDWERSHHKKMEKAVKADRSDGGKNAKFGGWIVGILLAARKGFFVSIPETVQ